jgi:hypothetical protein
VTDAQLVSTHKRRRQVRRLRAGLVDAGRIILVLSVAALTGFALIRAASILL